MLVSRSRSAFILVSPQDLVQEKVKCQQLTNELEALRSELQKMGLDQEKIQASAVDDE